MATGITFKNVYIAISLDGSNWTDISGQANSLTPGGGDREIGEFHVASADTPSIGAGKRAALEITVRVKYTENDSEPYGVLLAAATAGSEVYIRYAPLGNTSGNWMFTSDAGYIKSTPFVGQDVQSGDPLRFEAVFVVSELTKSTIA